MASFKIIGGKELEGTVNPQGAKNEALQIISAIILTKEKVIIRNIPLISDVICLIELLKGLGVKIQKINKHTYSFEASDLNLDYLKSVDFKTKSQKIRGSVMILGPLLSRFGIGALPRPGGSRAVFGQ